MKKKRRRILLGSIVCLLILVGLLNIYISNEKKRCQEYDAFMLVQSGSVNFQEEWFSEKWGIKTDIIESKMFRALFYTWNLNVKLRLYENAKTVFLEVPENIYEIGGFEQLITEHPELTFYIYCAIKPMDYWTEMADEEREEKLESYRQTYEVLSQNENVFAFEFYNMEWMINNQANYYEDQSFNEDVSYSLFVSFARHDNLYGENQSDYLWNIESSIEDDRISDKSVLVFGDSIWARKDTTMSIESVVQASSGVKIDNRAVGGSTAGKSEKVEQNFTYVVNEWIQEDKENPDFILIEYGINDYFEQEKIENIEDLYDEDTYKGALRKGIELLQEKSPNSKIILLGPSTIGRFDFGRENLSGEGTILDYEMAMEDVADEMNITMIENYDIGKMRKDNIEDYIELDQVHLNENGMYLYGKWLVDFLKESCK